VAGTYQQLARLDREGPPHLLAQGAERLVEPLLAQLDRLAAELKIKPLRER